MTMTTTVMPGPMDASTNTDDLHPPQHVIMTSAASTGIDDLRAPQHVIVTSDDDDDPVDDPRDVDYVPDEMQAKKRPTEAEKLHVVIARFKRRLASATAKLRAELKEMLGISHCISVATGFTRNHQFMHA